MKIMALDLATRTGFACGVAGGKPRVEAWILKRPKDEPELAPRNLGCTLRDNIRLENPGLIVVERYLNPVVSRNQDANVAQLQMHGCVLGFAGAYGIKLVRPTSAQFRKHFCGVSSAAEPRRRGEVRTLQQRAADREATNRMVLKRAILLGYLPRDSVDWDKANAVGLWDWGCAVHARQAPTHMHFFGEQPAEAAE